MNRILHITCDFRDAIRQDKTAAVSRLINETSQFSHTVLSLNRTMNPFKHQSRHSSNGVHSLYYFGLPFGICLRASLQLAARRILRYIEQNDLGADVIHCHKLTFEGVIGRALSQKLRVPYVLSFRGDTDFKLLRFKPTYAGLYRVVLRESMAVFFIAPWSMRKLTKMWPDVLPERKVLLPNIVDHAKPENSDQLVTPNHLVTVFHLKDYRRKNLKRLFLAVDLLNTEGTGVTLDVIGGGSTSTISTIEKMIAALQFSQNIRLLGHLSNREVSARLPSYAGLVLPSSRETFGMVYLEALQAGIPFLHSENAGVDGYFDDLGVSVSVDPKSAQSIANGILQLLNDQSQMRYSIKQLHESGGFDQFNTENIVRTYSETLASVLSGR